MRDDISSKPRENVLAETREKLIQPPYSFLPGSVPDGRGGYRARERVGNGIETRRGEGTNVGERTGTERASERERERETARSRAVACIDRPAENYPLAGAFAVCERPITYESSQWGALSRCSWVHADPPPVPSYARRGTHPLRVRVSSSRSRDINVVHILHKPRACILGV